MFHGTREKKKKEFSFSEKKKTEQRKGTKESDKEKSTTKKSTKLDQAEQQEYDQLLQLALKKRKKEFSLHPEAAVQLTSQSKSETKTLTEKGDSNHDSSFAPGLDSKYLGIEGCLVYLDKQRVFTAKITLVDSTGQILYDNFVAAQEPIRDFNTRWSGLSESMWNAGIPQNAKIELAKVQQAVFAIIKDKVLVGFGVKPLLDGLLLTLPAHQIRDLQNYAQFENDAQEGGLANLLVKYGDSSWTPQQGQVATYAKSSLHLFSKVAQDWEMQIQKTNPKLKKMLRKATTSTPFANQKNKGKASPSQKDNTINKPTNKTNFGTKKSSKQK